MRLKLPINTYRVINIANNYALIIGFFLLLIYNSPYLILGKDALYNIGDNLDGVVVMLKTMSNSTHYFSIDNNQYIESYIGGSMPRNAFLGPFNVVSVMFYFFQTQTAYLLIQYIVLLVGFTGMYLFITNYVFTDNKQNLFCMLISLTFAILPSKPIYGGAVFTITPFFFYAFFNLLYNKKIKKSLLLLLVLPFFSYVVINTIFSLFSLSLIWFYFCIRKKKVLCLPLLGLLTLFSGMVLADLQLFSLHLFSDTFVSHRIDRLLISEDFSSLIHRIWGIILTEKIFPTATVHHIIIFWFIITSIIGLSLNPNKMRLPFLLMFCIVINCLCSVLFYWDFLNPIKTKIALLNAFDFSRILTLNVFYWWLLFSLSTKSLYSLLIKRLSTRITNVCILIVCFSALLYVIRNSWAYRENVTNLFTNDINIEKYYTSNCLTISDFYSEKLFDEIKEFIGKEQSEYRVGSIGLHPAVPAYNGFFTIDGYSSMYSLDYKIKFREIIEPELKKYPYQLDKFDFWGNRCYLFSSELLPVWNHKDFIITKSTKMVINKLDFNFHKLKELGCDYILSTVQINNDQNPHLVFQEIFEHREFPYSIYLYSLI